MTKKKRENTIFATIFRVRFFLCSFECSSIIVITLHTHTQKELHSYTKFFKERMNDERLLSGYRTEKYRDNFIEF